jgi:hypothetical protein
MVVPGVPPSINIGRSRHWSEAHGATALYRSLAARATRDAAVDSGYDLLTWLPRPLRLLIWHFPDTLRGDTHNREKAVVDGVMDGLNMALEVTGQGMKTRKSFNDRFLAIMSMHAERDRDEPRVELALGPEDWFSWSFGEKAGDPDTE